MMDDMMIEQHHYDDLFTVYHAINTNANTFFHIQLEDGDNFYNSLYDYFFSEDRLIQYIKNKKGIKFSPSREQYVELFQHLQNYIDRENLEIDITQYNSSIISILKDEYETEEKDSKVIARTDKFGKIGEYIFCSLLSNYYGFNCIIPKVHYTTDNNMSVYGIDALFYSESDDLLLFGESKLCSNLGNGISLIKESLRTYQSQIQEEYRLILSGQILKNCSSIFNDKFGDIRDVSYTIEEFISKADIKRIGVPIFIAHGIETSEVNILKRLNSISQNKIFDLETIYYFISLPIINKTNLMKCFKNRINKRINEYKNA